MLAQQATLPLIIQCSRVLQAGGHGRCWPLETYGEYTRALSLRLTQEHGRVLPSFLLHFWETFHKCHWKTWCKCCQTERLYMGTFHSRSRNLLEFSFSFCCVAPWLPLSQISHYNQGNDFAKAYFLLSWCFAEVTSNTFLHKGVQVCFPHHK